MSDSRGDEMSELPPNNARMHFLARCIVYLYAMLR